MHDVSGTVSITVGGYMRSAGAYQGHQNRREERDLLKQTSLSILLWSVVWCKQEKLFSLELLISFLSFK